MIADRQLNLDDSYYIDKNNMIFILETVLAISQEPFMALTHVYMQNEREDTIFLHI